MELLGEVYLKLGRPVNAMRAFEVALIRYPYRAASLAGLHAAAKLAGDRETETRAEEELRTSRGNATVNDQGWKEWPCKECSAPN